MHEICYPWHGPSGVRLGKNGERLFIMIERVQLTANTRKRIIFQDAEINIRCYNLWNEVVIELEQMIGVCQMKSQCTFLGFRSFSSVVLHGLYEKSNNSRRELDRVEPLQCSLLTLEKQTWGIRKFHLFLLSIVLEGICSVTKLPFHSVWCRRTRNAV